MSSSTYDHDGYLALLVTLSHSSISTTWVLTIRKDLVPDLHDPKTIWNWEPLRKFLPEYLTKGERIESVRFLGGMTVVG